MTIQCDSVPEVPGIARAIVPLPIVLVLVSMFELYWCQYLNWWEVLYQYATDTWYIIYEDIRYQHQSHTNTDTSIGIGMVI